MPRIYKETATNVDRVEFNGKLYRRYPDSDRAHLRRYYSRSGGRGFLHRDVWEFNNGPIPEGCVIHHVDENHLNNDISNLECMSREMHAKHRHAKQDAHSTSEKQLAHLARIRAKAAEWHSSPEGVAWHRENGKNAWKNRKCVTLVCAHCGNKFGSKFSDAQFCSKSCGNKHWHKTHPEYNIAKNARRRAARIQHNGS